MILAQGTIVWVEVLDPSGHNPKRRPVVIVNPTHEITPGKSVIVVAGTTQVKKPLPSNQVRPPWKAGRHPVTGLYCETAFVCDWLVELTIEQIQAGVTHHRFAAGHSRNGFIPKSPQLRRRSSTGLPLVNISED